MAQKYRVNGNLAIKTVETRPERKVVRIPGARGCGSRQGQQVGEPPRSEVAQLLDNLEGEPFAKTRGDRIFAIGTVVVSCAAFLVLALIPIF